MIQILQIQTELLHPKGGTLPYRSGLSRLKMRKRQRWQTFIRICKPGKLCDDIQQFLSNQMQRLRHHNNIRIIPHIAGGSPQMNNPFSLGTLLPIGINMRHHIMAHFLLPRFRHIIINIILMRLQLINLLLGNIQPQLLLRLRQSNPEPPPGPKLLVRRKNVLHLLTRIAFG